MKLRETITSIRQYIAQDELPQALALLKSLLENSPQLDEVLLQSGRFSELRKRIRTGVIREADADVTKSQLREGLLDLLREIEEREVSISQKEKPFYEYADKKISKHLTPMPLISEVFIGREKELKDIHEELASGENVLLLVNGKGGMGKTTLASHYYHRHQQDYKHLAWLLSEKSIERALLRLSRELGLRIEDLEERDRLPVVLQALGNLQGPSLIVIDNANEVEDLRQQYHNLRRFSNIRILLTSRITDFSQARNYEIKGLSEANTLTLFKEHYPKFKPSEESTLLAIRKAVNANTLVLELFARNLHELNRKPGVNYGLDKLLADLQEKGLLHIKSTQVNTAYNQYETASPEAIITAMYELTDLEEAQTTWLAIFAALPAENILFSDLQRLLNLEAESPQTDALMHLVQLGWIEYEDEQESFRCSPVVQEVVKHKHPMLRESVQELINGLIKQLTQEVLHLENYRYSSMYVRYAEHLAEVLPEQFDDDLGLLFQNIGDYYTDTGDLSLALENYQRMEKVYNGLHESDSESLRFKDGLMISYQRLGSTYRALGNLHEALSFFEQNNELAKSLHEAYPKNISFKDGLAISYQNLGRAHSTLGNLDKALAFFEQNNELAKSLHEAYPQNISFKNGLSISYQYLGIAHNTLGNLDEALAFFEQYNELAKSLHEIYPQNVSFKNGLAISYSKLGDMYSALGNLDEALTFFEDATTLLEELYEVYPRNVSFKNGLAILYLQLGDTYSALGNLDEALTFFEDTTTFFEELYEIYPQNVSFKNCLAISYEKLGRTYSTLGNIDEALAFFKQCNQLAKTLHESYPQNVSCKNHLAISYANLAQIHIKLDQEAEALALFKQAEILWTELVRDALGYVEFQKYLGMVQDEINALEEK